MLSGPFSKADGLPHQPDVILALIATTSFSLKYTKRRAHVDGKGRRCRGSGRQTSKSILALSSEAISEWLRTAALAIPISSNLRSPVHVSSNNRAMSEG